MLDDGLDTVNNSGSGVMLQDGYKNDSTNWIVGRGFGKTESSRFHEEGSKNIRVGASLTASS